MYVECRNQAVLYVKDLEFGICEVVVHPKSNPEYKGRTIALNAVKDEEGLILKGGHHGSGFDVVGVIPKEVIKVVSALYYMFVYGGIFTCVVLGGALAWWVIK